MQFFFRGLEMDKMSCALIEKIKKSFKPHVQRFFFQISKELNHKLVINLSSLNIYLNFKFTIFNWIENLFLELNLESTSLKSL